MTRAIWFGGLIAALVVGTWVVGWWTVPIIAGAWGYLRRADAAAPLLAGLAALVAWGAILIVSASGAPDGSVMASVGRAMGVGSMALLALTLAFPALLAASAAAVVRAIARPRGARPA